ncbi:MAG: fibronectin type III domain-containing protein, partial [Candidatus Omnitrophica bacterium]|nr:fibronectin type III domain-containing protein [Candidatus Omnitrophota bacterium]
SKTTANEITLQWQAGASAAIADQFVILRKNLTANQQGYTSVGVISRGTTVGDLSTYFKDSTVSANTLYRYRVYWTGSNGELFDACSSNAVDIQTPANQGPPAAPSNLRVLASTSTRVNLYWQDNSSNENQFIVLRKNVSINQQGYSKIATLGGNTTFYSDGNVSPNTRYRYRVYSSLNGELLDSCSSNSVDISTGR